jgi:hypothetical protein
MNEEFRNGLDIKVARLEERLIASDRALELARESLKSWQAASNEWRQENIDQRAQYMTIDKTQALLAAESAQRYSLEARVRILEDTAKLSVGQHSAINTTWVVVAFIITTGIAIITVFVRSHP